MKLRVENNVVVEILQAIPGFSIEQSFHPDLLSQCFDWDGVAQVGWVLNEDGTFSDPNATTAAETPAAE